VSRNAHEASRNESRETHRNESRDINGIPPNLRRTESLTSIRQLPLLHAASPVTSVNALPGRTQSYAFEFTFKGAPSARDIDVEVDRVLQHGRYRDMMTDRACLELAQRVKQDIKTSLATHIRESGEIASFTWNQSYLAPVFTATALRHGAANSTGGSANGLNSLSGLVIRSGSHLPTASSAHRALESAIDSAESSSAENIYSFGAPRDAAASSQTGSGVPHHVRERLDERRAKLYGAEVSDDDSSSTDAEVASYVGGRVRAGTPVPPRTTAAIHALGSYVGAGSHAQPSIREESSSSVQWAQAQPNEQRFAQDAAVHRTQYGTHSPFDARILDAQQRLITRPVVTFYL
jgi:hypothetical protein